MRGRWLLVAVCACGDGHLAAPAVVGMYAKQASEPRHDDARRWLARDVKIDGDRVRWRPCDSVEDCEQRVEEAPFADLIGIETVASDAGFEVKQLRFTRAPKHRRAMRTSRSAAQISKRPAPPFG